MKGRDIGGIDELDKNEPPAQQNLVPTLDGSVVTVLFGVIIFWVYLSVRDLLYSLRERFL